MVGPLLVLAAALFWGTDALVRTPALAVATATTIVFAEHALGFLFLTPFMAWRWGSAFLALPRTAWLPAVFVGAGGSALATVLFTASFRDINPTVAILIQKLQPLFVVGVAYRVLGERPRPGFFRWALVALAAATLLSVPEWATGSGGGASHRPWRGLLLATVAATLWGGATVMGKKLLRHVPSEVATWWRYAVGLATMIAFVAFNGRNHGGVGQAVAFTLSHGQDLLPLALVAGALPMTLYYAGLKRTPASVATFIELVYPLSAAVLNAVFLGKGLTTPQVVAGAVLLLAIHQISQGAPKTAVEFSPARG
jgi:drug/metabolite transporter (DMT)-like permease